MKLNQSQKQAICHDRGPMMVLAGPGSGKTMVITHRVKWLIEQAGVHPAGILVVTFTKAAADEMRQRFISLMDGKVLPVSFGTFHAVFFSVLRHAYNYTAGNIIRDEQKQQFMREIIEDMPVEPDNVNEFIGDVLVEIGLVKGNMLNIDHYYATSCATSVFRDIYRQYVKRMENSRLIDFEDMMVYTYELFTERKDILAAWQQKYQYILIDEFQDINLLQYRLVRMLALPQNNIFIVGDDDQSIYGFRGARPEIMLNFEKDFPNVKKVLLSVNYRSQAAIVKGAGCVIRNNRQRFEKEIQAVRPEGKPIDIRVFQGPADENAAVIREIMNYHQQKDMPYSEMAVLFRTNTQSRMLLEKMMEYNIPFKMQDTMPNIYQHWIAQDVIAYIRIARGSTARGDYLRIINRPNRYVSRQAFGERQVAMDVVMEKYSDKSWMQERLSKFMYDVKMLKSMQPFAAINYIRHGIGYEEFLEKYAEERRLEKNELLEVLDELQESSQNYRTYEEWFDHIEIYTEQLKQQTHKQREDKGDSVSLATMHHSKGLEYEVVFIVDANETVTPHHKALLDQDIEEERRMFYVAMTRAKSELHIYFLKERYGRPMAMSRFVGEILVDRDAIRPGTRVVHQTYGQGIIQEVTEKAIVIRFDKIKQVKKLDIQFCLSNQLLKIL